MRLNEIYEDMSRITINTPQELKELATKHAILTIWEGEDLLVITDLPGGLSQEQFNTLLQKSFTPQEIEELDVYLPDQYELDDWCDMMPWSIGTSTWKDYVRTNKQDIHHRMSEFDGDDFDE